MTRHEKTIPVTVKADKAVAQPNCPRTDCKAWGTGFAEIIPAFGRKRVRYILTAAGCENMCINAPFLQGGDENVLEALETTDETSKLVQDCNVKIALRVQDMIFRSVNGSHEFLR